MKQWLRQKANGFLFRWKALQYGIFFIFSKHYKIPAKLWVNNSFRPFKFSFVDKNAFYYEFNEICLEDCYNLHLIKQRLAVSTIVDIGSNQGLFLLKARKSFPKANIHGYEPNPALKEVLKSNADSIQAEVYMEAVSDVDGFMQLEFGETDLHTVAVKSEKGIPAVSFSHVVERISGKIDLLKMDCEGGEWALLNIPHIWSKVQAITMEYHLWAKPQMTTDKLEHLLRGLGFEVLHLAPLSESFGLLTAVKKQS